MNHRVSRLPLTVRPDGRRIRVHQHRKLDNDNQSGTVVIQTNAFLVFATSINHIESSLQYRKQRKQINTQSSIQILLSKNGPLTRSGRNLSSLRKLSLAGVHVGCPSLPLRLGFSSCRSAVPSPSFYAPLLCRKYIEVVLGRFRRLAQLRG